MLVCSVSLSRRRAAVTAGITEAVTALDAPGTGNVVFATLVDDPASVRDFVDAFSGEVMREAASATATVNAGMANLVAISEAVTATDLPSGSVSTVATDPHWASVKLLMGFEGANGSTGAPGMTDESGAAHSNATVMNTAAISTARSKFGGSSLSIPGTTGHYIKYADHADWNLSNGPFTIEFWAYLTAPTGGLKYLLGQWESSPSNGWGVALNTSGQVVLQCSTTGSDIVTVTAGGSVLPANAWNAICIDFDGIKYRSYVNGVMQSSSTTLRTFFNSTNNLGIGGGSQTGNFTWSGNIDELRLTKGVARYASDSGYAVTTVPFPRS